MRPNGVSGLGGDFMFTKQTGEFNMLLVYFKAKKVFQLEAQLLEQELKTSVMERQRGHQQSCSYGGGGGGSSCGSGSGGGGHIFRLKKCMEEVTTVASLCEEQEEEEEEEEGHGQHVFRVN